jgi:hypothetical protein
MNKIRSRRERNVYIDRGFDRGRCFECIEFKSYPGSTGVPARSLKRRNRILAPSVLPPVIAERSDVVLKSSNSFKSPCGNHLWHCGIIRAQHGPLTAVRFSIETTDLPKNLPCP